jgi:hypothetical protein
MSVKNPPSDENKKEHAEKAYLLPDSTRQTMIAYIDNSNLPHNDVKQIIAALLQLKEATP